MNVYLAMNYGAWALSAIIFGWLLYDYVKTGKTYKESELLGHVDRDEFEGQEG